jgi:LmbE family N-acetylglucosaminyl deacetylase
MLGALTTLMMALATGTGTHDISATPRDAALVESAVGQVVSAPTPFVDDGKLRIVCFGAHPDDCELRAAGSAALWAEAGHHVKFVSVTNGDIGHWRMAGGPLAQRRTAEVERATEVLDIHDGEVLPTLENRRTITRIIRDWNADIVMCHRPNDYHPDHRNVGLLLQDAAFMVTVPYFCPDSPPLTRNPVFLYYEDRFQKPNPFSPDIVVGIDEVISKKLACVEALESQFYEGGCCSGISELPDTEEGQAARREQVRAGFDRRFRGSADRFRDVLVEAHGAERGNAIAYAEAFEICEYGRRPDAEDLKELFPFAYGE